ncbi:hypothetical protein ACHHV8_36695 [Paenibacillus sp. TAB 01]|uniref:hypothetical protein n=1 Tax=Paenibacillus sp. TAB 01 TaxID=3368988 RepID=UPI0037506C8F
MIGSSPTTTYFNLETNLDDNWDKIDLLVPVKSTADKTYYVSPAGSDSNNGTSAATPFKTVGKAVSMIPQVCNHLYTINVAAGTYAEDVLITGIVGSGTIRIAGVPANPDTLVINSIAIKNTMIIASVAGFMASSTTQAGFLAVRSKHVIFDSCRITASASIAGVVFDGTSGRCINSTISNRSIGIEVAYACKVYCAANKGSGNTIGMQAHEGGQIDYTGTYPGGTSAFSTWASGSISPLIVSATEGNITLYVATTGNDSNDGLTSGTALRTIQAAINRIPQIVNHQVTINVSAGTYSEGIGINGFMGKGSILLVGGTAVSDNYAVNSVDVFNCVLDVTIRGLKAISTTHDGFSAYGSSAVTFDACRCTNATTSFSAVIYNKSKGTVSGCELSNRQNGIFIQRHSIVFSTTNTGSGNTNGLQSSEASTLGKFSSQPAGTTAEATGGGGVIR